MNDYCKDYNFRIDLAYADPENLAFGEKIYRDDAKFWLHKDFAELVLRAAHICFFKYDLCFVLYDGLRTVTAQEAMLNTKRARENPHWLEKPRLFAPPGAGGHPRGMAIDLTIETPDGILLDMGTAFDHLTKKSDPLENPAHRKHPHNEKILNNRKMLNDSMLQAADECGKPLFLLPEEWWDFRFHSIVYNQYKALSDEDLPDDMRLCNV